MKNRRVSERRTGLDRRKMSYDLYIPERRDIDERRCDKERREPQDST